MKLKPENNMSERFNTLADKFVRIFSYLKAKLFGYPEYKNPSRSELIEIENALKLKNIHVSYLDVEISDFRKFKKEFDFGDTFYGGNDATLFNEKLIEHFIAFQLGIKKMEPSGVYVDIAAFDSPWVELLQKKGFSAFAIDLESSGNYDHTGCYMKMDATKTGFKDESIDAACLQCAYEMFGGEDDMKLIEEFGRILKPGGRVLISPLYMHTHHCGYCTPEFWNHRELHDPGAKLFVNTLHWGIPFSRKYDVEALERRVLRTVWDNNLCFNILILNNGHDIDKNIYCYFILEIYKKGKNID